MQQENQNIRLQILQEIHGKVEKMSLNFKDDLRPAIKLALYSIISTLKEEAQPRNKTLDTPNPET